LGVRHESVGGVPQGVGVLVHGLLAEKKSNKLRF
ncbi:MAG: hypothetical protein RI994_726, partial [Pseudomonadota bacterium]